MAAAGLAFILPDGTALFLKRSPGSDHPDKWCFPGGHLEGDESPEEAARREVREETGWVEPEDGDGKLHEVGKNGEFTLFGKNLNSPFIPTLNEEHTGWAWAPLKTPPEPLYPGMVESVSLLATDAMPLVTSPNSGMPMGKQPKNAYDYEFEPYLHPRYPKGTPKAGSFMPRGEEDKDKLRAEVAGGEKPPGSPGTPTGGEEDKNVKDLPAVKRKIRIDRTHEVQWMSVMSVDGSTMYVDSSLPYEITLSGKKLDPAEGLLHHEVPEWRAMHKALEEYKEEHGKEPSEQERVKIYLDAHNKVATPSEKRWFKENDYDWDAWEGWTKGVLAKLENRKITNPPPDPDVKPLPHQRGELKVDEGVGDKSVPPGLDEMHVSIAADGELQLFASTVMATDEALFGLRRARQGQVLALDKATVRSYDTDGRLHVAKTNISKAAVNPYLGREIPDWQQLGLDPDRTYKLLRHPGELEKAAATFNNIPLLSVHVPVSADDHQPDAVVGATGSNSMFEPPYLKNSLVVWAKPDIDAIEGGAKKELSSAYRYTADMTPGIYDGEAYDGIMRNIVGNHVALVKEGRAGSDVVVGDSGESVKEHGMSKTISRKAAAAIGVLAYYLKPELAQDAKPVTGGELLPVFAGVNSKNWKEKRPAIVEGLKGVLKGRKLAQDQATPDDVIIKLLEMVDGGAKGEEGLDESVSKEQHNAMAAAAEGEGNLGIPKEVGKEFMDKDKGKSFDDEDGGVCEEVCSLLDGHVPPEVMAKVKELLGGSEMAGDAENDGKGSDFEDPNKPLEHVKGGVVGHHVTTDKKGRKGAKDTAGPPPFKGMPKPGGTMVGDEKVSKQAMDEAVSAAVKLATDQAVEATIRKQNEIREAERIVRPYVGDLAMSFDSAEAIYRHTLKSLGIKEAEGIHASALPALLKLVPNPNEPVRPRKVLATDAASNVKGFSERHPETQRLKII